MGNFIGHTILFIQQVDGMLKKKGGGKRCCYKLRDLRNISTKYNAEDIVCILIQTKQL